LLVVIPKSEAQFLGGGVRDGSVVRESITCFKSDNQQVRYNQSRFHRKIASAAILTIKESNIIIITLMIVTSF
jgi:hypothetical protein